MRKFYSATNPFKTVALLFSFMLFACAVNAGTYYLTAAGAGNAQTAASWNTVAGGGGTAAVNFTTNGDIFIIPVGISGIVAGAWAFGDGGGASSLTLTINGTLTINSGVVLTLQQKNGGTASATVNSSGVLIFIGAGASQIAGSISGTGTALNNTLTLSSGAFLKTVNTNGIITGAIGSINLTNLKPSLNSGANYEFNGTSAQATLGLPATVNTLTINNAAGVNLSAATTVSTLTIGSVTVNSILNDNGNQITSTGTINISNGGTFNVGTGATNTAFPAFTSNNILAGTTVNYNSTASQTVAAVNYGNLSSVNAPRIFAAAGTIGIKNAFTPGSGAYTITTSTVNFNGTAAQTIPAFTFNNLQINNSAGISSIGGNITVSASLTLTNGIVTTGINKIIIPNGGATSRTNGWINGSLQKYFTTSNTGNVIFEVGDATTYNPVTINFATILTAGSLTLTATQGLHPAISTSGLNSAKTVTEHWNLTSGGVAGNYSVIFGFDATRVPGGAITNNFVVRNYNNPNWTTTTTGILTTTSSQVTGLNNIFGDFAIGESSGIPAATTNPSNASVCLGNNVTFTSASTSTPPPTVQWQRSADGGSTWVNIIGTTDGSIYSNYTTNTLNITAPPVNSPAYQYRSVYTNINGSGNSSAAILTVTKLPTITTFTYTTSPFANITSTPQTVTLAGTNAYTGGTYSSDVNLTINAATGAITPNTSTLGNHTVTYTIAAAGGCSQVTATTTINITTSPTAVITYSASAYCISDATPHAVTLTGTGAYTGGTYTPDAGLVMNASGTITASGSTAGNHVVTYTIPAGGGFPASNVTTNVTITAIPTASISYPGGPFCSSDQTANSVTLTGTAAYTGGTFSASPSGLVLNGSTGSFTPYGSTSGTSYTVTYTIPASGGCAVVPVSATPFSIATVATASISYTGSPYCQAFTTAQPVTITGATGGSFSASPSGLTIDPATGAITPGTSTAGPYTVTYTIPASGPCGIVQITTPVTISVSPTGTINYPLQPYCTADPAKAVTLTGTGAYAAGTYSSTSGLTINSSTGTITPSSTTPNIYTVTYTTAGCPVTFTNIVQVDGAPTAAISYVGAPFCSNDGSLKSVTLSGTGAYTGGTYSTSPSTGLSIDPTSGVITPSTSTAGVYSVSYTIPASGNCPAVVATTSVTVTALPTATISYAGTPFCKSLGTAQPVTLSGTNVYTGGTYSSTAGLTINSSTGAITPGTSTAGTYLVAYTLTAAGGCGVVTATTSVTITAVPTATISYSNPSYCISDASTYIVTTTGTGAYTGGSFGSSPAGLTIDAAGTITPGSSTAGTYTVTYTIPASAGCATVPVNTTVTITANGSIILSSLAGTDAQTKCISTAITNITYAVGGTATGASVTAGALPTGVSGNFSGGVFTISGTPAFSGTFNYTVTTSGSTCVNPSLSGTITVTANGSIILSSLAGTDAQTKCISTAITNITYAVGGTSTGASITAGALPTGVSGNFSGGVFTISGTATVSGTFNYTVTTSGSTCVNPFLTGTITVTPNATINLTSPAPTTSQTVCINNAITNITYAIAAGGTGATFSGLPAGVTGGFSGGVATISGTPTASGTFNYTVNTTGTCVQTSAGGSITVNAASIGGSLSPTLLTICSGSSTGTITLSGYTGSIIRWEQSINAGSTWTSIANTAATYSTTVTQPTLFRAVVQNGVGICAVAYSAAGQAIIDAPFTPIITALPGATVCYPTPVTLTASGYTNSGLVISGGDFATANPLGWNGASANNSNGDPNSGWGEGNGPKAWNGVTYNSSGKFMIINGTGTPGNLNLTSPIFSLVGLSSAYLALNQAYNLAAGSQADIQISIDGGASFTTLPSYTTVTGLGPAPGVTYGPTNGLHATDYFNLSPYLGMTNLQIRFSYTGSAGSNWAVDNIFVTNSTTNPTGVGVYNNVTYTWSPAANLSATTGQSVTFTPTAIGSFSYNVTTTTSAAGCVSAIPGTITVVVNPLPTITGTLAVCITSTTQLTGSGTPASTNPWVSATTSVATVSNTGLVTGVAAGTSVITYTNSNGCSITATVTVNTLPTITGTLSVCIGSTTTLIGSATADATTPWVSASTGVATINSSGVVTGVAAGTSVVTYKNTNGCTITATVTVNALPTITGTLSVCIGSTTTLTGSATANATTPWVSASTGVATINSSGVVTGVAAGTSVITYKNTNGCTTTATVTVNALPTITGTLSVCVGSTTTLTGSATPDATTPWVSASTGVATINSSGVVTGVAAGTSVITYKNTNGCTITATVTVNALPTVTVAASTVCGGAPATITANPGSPGTYTYAWTVPATATNPGNVSSFTSTVTGNYSVRITNTATGCVSVSSAPASVTAASNTWTGAVSTDWQIIGNWSCGAIPTAISDVIIPTGVTNMPQLTAASFTKSLTLQAGTVVDLNGQSLTNSGAVTGAGSFKGSLTSNLTINAPGQNSTINFDLTTKDITNALNNLTVDGSGATVTLNSKVAVYGTLLPKAGTLTINDTLTLRSISTATAMVGQVTGSITYGASGKVAVERYYPARRAWRLVTAPVSGAGSVFNTWQNAGSATYIPGRFTYVSGPGANLATNGLDPSPLNNTSLRVGNALTTVGNTQTELLSTNTGTADNKGFLIFVRGDRLPGLTLFDAVSSNNTTLSSTGTLQTGNQQFPATATFGGFTLIGNPYASPVDFAKLSLNNLSNKFYVFDPNINTQQGAFVTMLETFPGSGIYYGTPSRPGGQTGIIQSSQAFFVETSGASPSVLFTENSKSNINNLTLFKPMNPTVPQSFRTNLYVFDNTGKAVLADGNLARFDDSYNPGVDLEDALKFGNVYETFGILSGSTSLAVSSRPVLTKEDTIYYKLSKSKQLKYQFEFEAANIERDNLAGFVEDKFLQKATPINMNGNTRLDFEGTSDAASRAVDRFKVVFKPSVIYTSLAANVLGSDIGVEWNVANETNIKGYDIERSTDGTHFTKVSDRASSGNSATTVGYNWLDVSPALGYYYYRIRSISHNNVVGYSNVVKVKLNKSTPAIYVFPNPVIENIHLQMNSMPKGIYYTRLVNNVGQIIGTSYIGHLAGTATETITPNNKLLTGIYQLEITAPDKKTTTIKVIVK